MKPEASNFEFLFSDSNEAYSKLKSELEKYDDWALLVDENTEAHCKAIFLQKLNLHPKLELSMSSGEQNKNLGSCQELWTQMLESGMTRNSALVNLGGGVITDLGGYVAGCYKRGIDFYNVPTTLLSMVDASYGGKTGVNLRGIKNQIGLFKHPRKTLIDKIYLKTLAEIQVESGFAEVIKHAIIDGPNFWSDIKAINVIDGMELDALVQKSITVKMHIITEDPEEQGIRKKLNFGHSVGHALESLFSENKEIFHGQAIAAGMICEAYISMKAGLLEEKVFEEITEVIQKHFKKLPIEINHDATVIESVYHDKKNSDKALKFTLISDIGTALIDQVLSEEKILDSLHYYRQLK